MKKPAALLAAVLFVSTVLAPLPAAAARPRFRVASTTKYTVVSGKTTRVAFKTRMTRPGRVKVTIYKGTKRIRTVKASGTWYRKQITWNVRDSKGRRVQAGTYSYKITAVRRGITTTKRGTIKVRTPKPAPTPTAPTQPPVTEPTTPPTTTQPPATEPTAPTTPTEPSTTVPSTPSAEPTTPTTTQPSTPPTVAPVVPPTTTPSGTGRWVGAYVPGAPSSMAPITDWESRVGARAAVVNFFVADSESFPAPRLNNIRSYGSTPMLTLEFWSIQNSGGLSAIVNGSKDAYLVKFADAAKAYGGEIWLRPMHEMNGDWYPWGGTVGDNTPAEYVSAWRHIYDVFKSRGATNVKFVWCVNNDSVPNTSENAIASYWPGDAYVDYLSIDGYNAGTTQSWSSWRPFSNMIGASYAAVTKLSADPLFLAETSSVEAGGSKAAWITDMFYQIRTKYTRIRGVCWFNASLTNDWRVETSSSAVSAFKAGVASGY